MSGGRFARGSAPRGGQAGQSVVEFAMMATVLLLILFGVLDLGRCFYTYIGLTNAAREAARYGALNSGAATSAQAAKEYTSADGGNLSGCASALAFTAPTVPAGEPYKVTVSCEFQLITPFIGNVVGANASNRFTISSTATFVKEIT